MQSKNESCIQNVACSVKDCKYHEIGNYCVAGHINVQNENAQNKTETFCGTFSPRSSS